MQSGGINMPKPNSRKTYKYNDPKRPFTKLTWQLVATMIAEDRATPAEIASLFNRDINHVASNLKEAHVSGQLESIMRNLPQGIPEQSYRNLASRVLADTYKDATNLKQIEKGTAKPCRASIETATKIKNFIDSGWAETLCTTANIDLTAYKNSIEQELKEFWMSVDSPLVWKNHEK